MVIEAFLIDNLSFTAEEYRNLIIVFFPALLACTRQYHLTTDLLLKLTYIYRAYLMPDEVYEHIDKAELVKVTKAFQADFEEKFGEAQAFYNLHLMGHLHESRKWKGCLTNYSTLPFESSYAVIKAGQTTGTRSLGKQSIECVTSKYYSQANSHKCEMPLHFAVKCTTRTDDTLLAMTVNTFMKCTTISEAEVSGYLVDTAQFGQCLTSDPHDWKKIGVMLWKGVSQTPVTLRKRDVFGKGVLCDNVICSVPLNVLRDH